MKRTPCSSRMRPVAVVGVDDDEAGLVEFEMALDQRQRSAADRAESDDDDRPVDGSVDRPVCHARPLFEATAAAKSCLRTGDGGKRARRQPFARAEIAPALVRPQSRAICRRGGAKPKTDRSDEFRDSLSRRASSRLPHPACRRRDPAALRQRGLRRRRATGARQVLRAVRARSHSATPSGWR